MDDGKINIRIFIWHLMVGVKWEITIKYNNYHKGLKHGWFAVYKFKPFKNYN